MFGTNNNRFQLYLRSLTRLVWSLWGQLRAVVMDGNRSNDIRLKYIFTVYSDPNVKDVLYDQLDRDYDNCQKYDTKSVWKGIFEGIQFVW